MADPAISLIAATKAHATRLWPLMRDHKSWFGFGIVCVFLSIGLTLVYPQVIRIIVDEGIQRGNPERVNELAFLMVIILLVEAPATYFRTYFFDVGARKTTYRLQEKLHGILIGQETGFFDSESAAELNARLTHDTEHLSTLIGEGLPEGVRFFLYGVCGFGFMVYTSPMLSLLVLVVGPPVAYGTAVLGRKIQKTQASTQHAFSAASASALESISGIRTVRAYDQEDAERKRYSQRLRTLLIAGNRRIRASAMLDSVTTFSSESAVVVAIWAGGTLVVSGALTAGALISFIIYAGLVVRSFKNLSRFGAEIMRAHGATERIFELMARESQMPAGGLRPARCEGRLELQGVHFRYPTKRETPTLRGVDLLVEPGEFVAIVGPSGSGKSTIAAIIARLYDCDEGRVLLDGIDVRDLDAGWLRQHVTLVSQDSFVFTRTLAENVMFGNPEASPEEVDSAIRSANASEFVDGLEQGLHTHVGDRGQSFSGGQLQRLVIARALLRKPRILILDEATSGLDAESEALVKEALRKLPYHPSILIVAHRLSTVVDADRVVVVEAGRIVANAPHDELLLTSSVYQDLVETQLVQK